MKELEAASLLDDLACLLAHGPRQKQIESSVRDIHWNATEAILSARDELDCFIIVEDCKKRNDAQTAVNFERRMTIARRSRAARLLKMAEHMRDLMVLASCEMLPGPEDAIDGLKIEEVEMIAAIIGTARRAGK
jgi:hypothetical protein